MKSRDQVWGEDGMCWAGEGEPQGPVGLESRGGVESRGASHGGSERAEERVKGPLLGAVGSARWWTPRLRGRVCEAVEGPRAASCTLEGNCSI